MTRNGLMTIPPVRPPVQPDRRFALHFFARTCRRVGGICANPPLAESEQNGRNLNISRYVDVDTSEEDERIVIAEAVRKLRELERGRAAVETTMNWYLAELEYGA